MYLGCSLHQLFARFHAPTSLAASPSDPFHLLQHLDGLTNRYKTIYHPSKATPTSMAGAQARSKGRLAAKTWGELHCQDRAINRNIED